MIMLPLSSLTLYSLVLLSVVVAITQQRECYKWEYRCLNSDGCCNCLMCPGTSGCTRTLDQIEPVCKANIPIRSYDDCDSVAHCGWTEQKATFPKCPTILAPAGIIVKYISPNAYFRDKYVQNHLYAEAQITCDDGTNSTAVKCLPGGADGNGGKWNGSTSIRCSNTEDGAIVVSTPPNQKLSTPSVIADVTPKQKSPTPSVIVTSDDTQPTYEVQTTSGKNITILVPDKSDTRNVTSAESGLSRFVIFLIYGVSSSVVVGLVVGIIIYCCCCRKPGTDSPRDSEDGGPGVGDHLMQEEKEEDPKNNIPMEDTATVLNETDHCVSRDNPHASENGHCVQNVFENTEPPHANGEIPACRLLAEASERGPTESSVESLEMQARGDDLTLQGNLDECRRKDESIRKKMPSNNLELCRMCRCPVSLGNSHPSAQQARRGPVEDDVEQSACSVNHSCHCPVAVVNPLSQAQANGGPVEQDDRNIQTSSRSSLSTGGSDSDNQASTSQTIIKELFDSGQDMDQGVREVNGSNESLPTCEDFSKADPVDHRNDGQGYYTGPGSPEEVNTEITQQVVDTDGEGNQLGFPVAGASSGQAPGASSNDVAPDATIEELEHASGGPSDEVARRHNGRNMDGNQDLVAQGNGIDAAARNNGLYHGDPEGERHCNTTLKQASNHLHFQEFVMKVQMYTDRPGEPWRQFGTYVCDVHKPGYLDHIGYAFLRRGDSMGIGGRLLYNRATNSEHPTALYRLVHFIADYSEVPQRLDFLKLVKDSFPEHSQSCEACRAVFERFGFS